MVAKGHVGSLPSVEEDTHVDGAAGALVVTDGPVLLEGGSSINGGSIGAGALVELVGRAIVLDGATRLASRARVVLAVRLDNVVLDKRAASPAINSKILDTHEGVSYGALFCPR